MIDNMTQLTFHMNMTCHAFVFYFVMYCLFFTTCINDAPIKIIIYIIEEMCMYSTFVTNIGHKVCSRKLWKPACV